MMDVQDIFNKVIDSGCFTLNTNETNLGLRSLNYMCNAIKHALSTGEISIEEFDAAEAAIDDYFYDLHEACLNTNPYYERHCPFVALDSYGIRCFGIGGTIEEGFNWKLGVFKDWKNRPFPKKDVDIES